MSVFGDRQCVQLDLVSPARPESNLTTHERHVLSASPSQIPEMVTPLADLNPTGHPGRQIHR